MQYGMVIDLNRCVGCHACTIACKAEWEVPPDEGRNWVRRLGPEKTDHGMASTYYVGLCNHCDKPVCVDVCPATKVEKTFTNSKTNKSVTISVSATYKDPFNGTVQIDKDRCLGCGACAKACPYHARYVNRFWENGKMHRKADKCTYCMDRVELGLQPACVQTCLAKARIFGNLNDPQSEVSHYIKKGAVGLTSANVQLGPNSRFYGSKRDMALLVKQAPRSLPKVNVTKRELLSELIDSARDQLTIVQKT